MCYELGSWSWKARAKELHKAQVKAESKAKKTAPADPPERREQTRPEVKEHEKAPA